MVFDLDGTLAESKQPISPDMAERLEALLRAHTVAVISGGTWEQFRTQLIAQLILDDEEAKRLHLFPTIATSHYRWTSEGWKSSYSMYMIDSDKRRISAALDAAWRQSGLEQPTQTWGPQFEDRGSQITFSALGQQAPPEEKRKWDPTFVKRLGLVEHLARALPEFSVRAGGMTSIDVTPKGMDKAYGIREIEHHLDIPIADMVFVGDALFPGGNDHPVTETGVATVLVSGPAETLAFIDALLAG